MPTIIRKIYRYPITASARSDVSRGVMAVAYSEAARGSALGDNQERAGKMIAIRAKDGSDNRKNKGDKGTPGISLLGAAKLQSAPDADNPLRCAVAVRTYMQVELLLAKLLPLFCLKFRYRGRAWNVEMAQAYPS